MRYRLLGLVFLVACGSDDKPNIIDAPPIVPDTPAFTCGLPAMIGAGTVNFMGQPLTGQTTMATPKKFVVPIVVVIKDTPPTQGLFFIWVDGAGMFVAGQAGPMTGPPTLNAAKPLDVGNTCGGCLEGYSEFTISGNTVNLQVAKQGFTRDAAPSGTMTFTAWAPAAAPLGSSTIAGSYDLVKLTGQDLVTMMPTTCKTDIMKITFSNMVVNWPALALAPEPRGDGPFGIDMSKVNVGYFQPDE